MSCDVVVLHSKTGSLNIVTMFEEKYFELKHLAVNNKALSVVLNICDSSDEGGSDAR